MVGHFHNQGSFHSNFVGHCLPFQILLINNLFKFIPYFIIPCSNFNGVKILLILLKACSTVRVVETTMRTIWTTSMANETDMEIFSKLSIAVSVIWNEMMLNKFEIEKSWQKEKRNKRGNPRPTCILPCIKRIFLISDKQILLFCVINSSVTWHIEENFWCQQRRNKNISPWPKNIIDVITWRIPNPR